MVMIKFTYDITHNSSLDLSFLSMFTVPKLSFPILGHFLYFGKYEKVGSHRMFIEWGKECQSSIIGVDFGLYK